MRSAISMHTNKLAISKKILDIRKKLGLSQPEFADALGVAKSTASRYENGRIPEADILYKIAQLAGVTMESILEVGGVEPAKLPSEDTRQRLRLHRQLMSMPEKQGEALAEKFAKDADFIIKFSQPDSEE